MSDAFCHAVVAIALLAPGVSEAATHTLSLNIEPRFQVTREPSAVSVTVILRNTGAEEYRFLNELYQDARPTECLVQIHDQDGRTPDFSELGNEINGNRHTIQAGGAADSVVPAGQAREESFPIGSLYRLLPGHRYTFRIAYGWMMTGMQDGLQSDQATIEVK